MCFLSKDVIFKLFRKLTWKERRQQQFFFFLTLSEHVLINFRWLLALEFVTTSITYNKKKIDCLIMSRRAWGGALFRLNTAPIGL